MKLLNRLMSYLLKKQGYRVIDPITQIDLSTPAFMRNPKAVARLKEKGFLQWKKKLTNKRQFNMFANLKNKPNDRKNRCVFYMCTSVSFPFFTYFHFIKFLPILC